MVMNPMVQKKKNILQETVSLKKKLVGGFNPFEKY